MHPVGITVAGVDIISGLVFRVFSGFRHRLMETDRRISKYSAGIWLIGFGIGDDFSVDPAGYVGCQMSGSVVRGLSRGQINSEREKNRIQGRSQSMLSRSITLQVVGVGVTGALCCRSLHPLNVEK